MNKLVTPGNSIIFMDMTLKSLEINHYFYSRSKNLKIFQVFRYQTAGIYINVVFNSNF